MYEQKLSINTYVVYSLIPWYNCSTSFTRPRRICDDFSRKNRNDSFKIYGFIIILCEYLISVEIRNMRTGIL